MSKASKKRGGGRSSGFSYKPRSEDDVRRRADQQGGQFDSIFKQGFDSWRPKDGENVIRILPPTWDDHDHYGYDIWVHSFVGPDKSTYLCPEKMLGKPCPICDAARAARNAGEEDEAKQLTARRQVATWILDRDNESTTPALFTMSWTMDKDIALLCQNKRTGQVLLIDHPDEGYDVMFTRTGKGLNTRYGGMAVDRESRPIMDDERDQDEVIEFIQENPIPDVLNFYSEEHLHQMIQGGTDERDEDLDEDEEEDRGRSRSRSRGKRDRDRGTSRRKSSSRRDPEPDEEEDDTPEEDEDEDRGRSRGRDRGGSRRSSRRRDPEPDDEEEAPDDEDIEESDEEEEEEEDRGRSRGSRSRGRSRSRDEEDEDENGDEDEEDPDEEEEDPDEEEDDPPARRSKPRSSGRRSSSRRR